MVLCARSEVRLLPVGGIFYLLHLRENARSLGNVARALCLILSYGKNLLDDLPADRYHRLALLIGLLVIYPSVSAHHIFLNGENFFERN